jgi:aspartate beta-hydroxylase/beta-hydroxylase
MDPGKSVPLHKGPYLGYLRYHLGVKVPTENPPKIVVDGQPYTWKNGEDVMFDDSYPHEVINTCKEPRVVLIIDILRPLPFLPNLLNKIAVHGIAKYTYGRWVMNRVEKFKNSDGILTLR